MKLDAQFRIAHDLFDGDPAFNLLTDYLHANSVEFRPWWGKHDIATSTSGTKTIWSAHHASTWRHSTFQSNDDPNLGLVLDTRTQP